VIRLSQREDSGGDVDGVVGGDAHGGWDAHVGAGIDVKAGLFCK